MSCGVRQVLQRTIINALLCYGCNVYLQIVLERNLMKLGGPAHGKLIINCWVQGNRQRMGEGAMNTSPLPPPPRPVKSSHKNNDHQ